MSDMHTTTPWALSHEQRILAVLEEIRDEMILLRGDVQHLYTAQTAGAPQPKPAKGRK